MIDAAREDPGTANQVTFETLTSLHRDTILGWLDKPHVREFWDNSDAHREDIDHFIGGRKGPSSYFDGAFSYWVGFINGEPFCFIMTSEWVDGSDLPESHKPFLSRTGRTISLDFCIGNETYLGRGLAAATLTAFMKFFVGKVDSKTDTFFIDPDDENPRARHVYEKAGFRDVAEFTMSEGVFEGQKSHLMIHVVYPEPQLIPAVMGDCLVVQNLARFYIYDVSRYCGNDPTFATPEDGIFECFDLVNYFVEEGRYAFLVKVGDELAGFVLIHTFDEAADWSMGEFFILAKFQRHGIGKVVAKKVFEKLPGRWIVAGIPENTPAIHFWNKAIRELTGGKFEKHIEYLTTPNTPTPHPKVVWRFEIQ